MEKISSLVLACCLILLSACNDSVSSKPSDSTNIAENSTSSKSLIKPKENDTSDNSNNTKDENSVNGEIVDATMNTITIKTDDGEQVAFSKTDVPVNSIDGLLLGDYVIIYFVGTIEDNQVTKIDEIIK